MSNTELLSSEAANGVAQAGRQESEQSGTGSETNGTPRRRGGLSGMVLAELRQLAGELGIETTGLRKGDLIAAIKERQGGAAPQRSRSTKKPSQGAEDSAQAKAHQPALDESDADSKQRDTEQEIGRAHV